MSTRAERRRTDRMLKKHFTDEQYKEFKSGVIKDTVKDILDSFSKKLDVMLYDVLRDNRVGEDRANKILQDLSDKLDAETVVD